MTGRGYRRMGVAMLIAWGATLGAVTTVLIGADSDGPPILVAEGASVQAAEIHVGPGHLSEDSPQ